jgi:hypothetical protein
LADPFGDKLNYQREYDKCGQPVTNVTTNPWYFHSHGPATLPVCGNWLEPINDERPHEPRLP